MKKLLGPLIGVMIFSSPISMPSSDNHKHLKSPKTIIIENALEHYDVALPGLVSLIINTAYKYSLDPLMLVVILKQESDFRVNVTSSKGAIGIAQIMPFWARERGFDPLLLYDIDTNIDTCGYVLRHYLDRFKGNKFKAVRAYFGQCDAGTVYAQKIFKKYDKIMRL